jgi:ABC-type antimicrobial peptide transport system permease subunit
MRVTPAYFDTMGIELIEGATFDGGLTVDSDPARPAVILSEGLARKLFPEGPATGRTLTLRERRDVAVAYEIVGVARDAHLRRLLDEDIDIVYEPFGQRYWPQNIGFQLRSSVAPGAILGEVRRAMLEADATLPAYDVVTAVDKIDGTIAEHRLVAGMSSALAAMALLLAGVGIYGVVATSVRLRFHEIGVRMALGARPSEVRRMVLRQAGVLAVAGVAVGLAAALVLRFGLGASLTALLFGGDLADPLLVGGVAAVVVAAALLATWIPARRATRVEPTVALRAE